MNSLTKDRAKEKAQNLKKILDNLGHDIGIRHCYEVLAKTSGYESWNAMSAKLEDSAQKPAHQKPAQELWKHREEGGNHIWEAEIKPNVFGTVIDSGEAFIKFEGAVTNYPFNDETSTYEMMGILENRANNFNAANPLSEVIDIIKSDVLTRDPSDYIEGASGDCGEGKNLYDFELEAPAKVTRNIEVRGDTPKEAFLSLQKYLDGKDDSDLFDSGWDFEESDAGIEVKLDNTFLPYTDPRDGDRKIIVSSISRYEGNINVFSTSDYGGVDINSEFKESKIDSVKFEYVSEERYSESELHNHIRENISATVGNRAFLGRYNLSLQKTSNEFRVIVTMEAAEHDIKFFTQKYCEVQKISEEKFRLVQNLF